MAQKENSIEVVEQKTVLFYEDELVAVRGDDGHIYVSFRHLCDSIGVNRQSQMKKIRDHDVLHEGYKGGVISTPPSKSGRGGGYQQASLLRVDLVPMWLTTINVSRVKEDVRPKIKQYQKEAAKVLWEAFREGRLNPDVDFQSLLQNTDSPAVQAYHTFQALAKLARHQLILESRVTDNTERIEQLESIIGDPKHRITLPQATQLSQAVRAIGLELGKRSGRNEYGGVYGELYRRFEITSYKELPKSRFDEAMTFLNGWYAQITGDNDVPF